jgi:ketosteroid isomerase-like protein
MTTRAPNRCSQRSQELLDLLAAFYRAAQASDMDALERLISHSGSALMIGSDPQEWWSGYDDIRRVFIAQMEEMGGFPLSPGDPVAYAEGTMGWIADRPTLALPDGKLEMRVSFVAHREDGQWRLVHGHFSIGVSNEETVGQELTV